MGTKELTKEEIEAKVAAFRCPVCETVGKWKNMDKFRQKQVGMSMCAGCGFVTYPSKYMTEDEIKAYYRSSYRPAPQAGNLFTGERKLQYHAYFLKPLFEEWENAGIKTPVIGEVGSAYGLFLNWIKNQWPEADVHGTELTETYKRVCFHEFGIKLTDDFDRSKKYDLITSYHVLEHQLDPDIRLRELRDCLKDNGVIYLSLPIWFREASNAAFGGFDVDQYWHPDHINGWAEEHIDWIIAKAGLEPIMKNTNIYGNTYILKKADPKTDAPKFKVEWYEQVIERIFQCWLALQEGRTANAIETWANCPTAWVHHYEHNRASFHKDQDALKKLFNDVVACCPNSAEAHVFVGDVLSRYEKWDESLHHFNEALKRKPNNPSVLENIHGVLRQKAMREKDPAKKVELFRQARDCARFIAETSTEYMPKAISWIYHDEAQMPIDPV